MTKIVFVHGTGSTHATWDAQRAAFPDADAVDLPGHPEGQPSPTVDGYRDWLRDYIQRKGYAGEVVIVGHSLGGAIVLSYALAYPEDLKGIVLANTGARLRVLPQILTKLTETPEKGQRLAIDLACGPDITPEQKAAKIAEMTGVPAAVMLNDFTACDRFDVMARLGEIKLPVLAITGGEDRLTPPKYSEYFGQHLPNCRVVIVPRAGHELPIENPQAFNQELKEFVEGLS